MTSATVGLYNQRIQADASTSVIAKARSFDNVRSAGGVELRRNTAVLCFATGIPETRILLQLMCALLRASGANASRWREHYGRAVR